jgi:hypothetical protein
VSKNGLHLIKKEVMTQVGTFVVKQVPKDREVEIDSMLGLYFRNLGEDNFAITSNESGNETVFIFSDDETIDKFRKIFISYDLLVSFQYATKDFLFQKNLHEIFQDEYREVLSYFLFLNLTKDDVLDKILDMGIGSLTKYDYQILNR